MDMRQVVSELFRPRGRVSAMTSRVLLGLAVVGMLLAVSSYFSFEGGHRIAATTAFGLAGLANLLNALGSILPEDQGAGLARLAVIPAAMLMFVALTITLLYQVGLW